MATDAVPARASSTSIAEAWWFRFLVRAVLVVLAFLMLRLAADQLRTLSLGRSVSLQLDTTLWLESIGSTVAAGLLFGLATWLPFTSVRLLPSRLVLAVVALLPVAHFWWGFVEGHATPGGWLGSVYWFDNVQSQFAFAGLAGVAIASVLGTRRSDPSTD
jgi:hypothetical protein